MLSPCPFLQPFLICCRQVAYGQRPRDRAQNLARCLQLALNRHCLRLAVDPLKGNQDQQNLPSGALGEEEEEEAEMAGGSAAVGRAVLAVPPTGGVSNTASPAVLHGLPAKDSPGAPIDIRDSRPPRRLGSNGRASRVMALWTRRRRLLPSLHSWLRRAVKRQSMQQCGQHFRSWHKFV